MARNKKLDGNEAVTAEAIADSKDAEEEKIEEKELKLVKKIEEKEREAEPEGEKEESDEEKPRKKKEKKRLSETELKRVMTDTKETLVPLTDYIACSVHLGTKVITPDTRKFVYKRRADGLAVLNTNLIDDKLREAAKYLNEFNAGDVFIVCKREAGWPSIEKFSEVTGIRCFTKKYPAGIITNLTLETFFEPKLAIVCDPWVDKNALNDSLIIKIPVIGICDTNNYAHGITKIIPSNNKSRKSIGIILYILAREYLKAQGKDKEAKALVMEDFTGKIEDLQASFDSSKAYSYGV